MKIATWAAAIAVAGGVAVLAAYWFVSVLDVLFEADDVPLLIRIAVPAVVGGSVVLLLVAVLQRLRDRKDEDLEGVDY
jgi:TRAP-type C4-dicarboxylate transport system permease small subunit